MSKNKYRIRATFFRENYVDLILSDNPIEAWREAAAALERLLLATVQDLHATVEALDGDNVRQHTAHYEIAAEITDIKEIKTEEERI